MLCMVMKESSMTESEIKVFNLSILFDNVVFS